MTTDGPAGTSPGTYRYGADADVPAHLLFAFIARAENLPRYFPAITSVERNGDDTYRVQAEVQGRRVEGSAWLRADERNLQLEWGADGPHDYHGDMTVRATGAGTCAVEIRVHTTRAGGQRVQEGLEHAVATMTQQAVVDIDRVDPAGLGSLNERTPGR